MSQQIFGAAAAVIALNRAFNDQSTSNAVFTSQLAVAQADATNGYANFASQFAASYSGLSNSDLSTKVMTNMGLLPNDALKSAMVDYLNGPGAANRGLVVLQLSNILSNLETATGTQSVYNAAALAWNNKVTAAYTYSSNTANTSASSTGDVTGQSFTLTSNIDTFTGGSGNDTFIADNAALSAADSVNGSTGTDTFKIYGITAANALALPQMTAIENLYLNAAAASLVLDVSGKTGLTSVELDGQLGTAATVTVTTGQAVKLSNVNAAAFTTTIAGNTPTSLDVTFNKVGTAAIQEVVDFSGTALTTVNITATGTNSVNTSLTNTGAKLNKLVISGDKGLTMVENAATSAAVKTIDASADTGGVKIDKTAGAANAAFAFTGGSGDDILILKAGDLAALTAGSQIAMGTGTDKVGIFDLTAALTAPVLAKINAITGVEVLGLNAAQAIDASQLTSIKTFSLDTDAIQSITKMVTGSEVKVTAAHAATFGSAGDVGVTDLKLTIGQAASNTEAATAGLNNIGVFTIGQTNVALASNGTNAAANQLAVANADNSVYTITGSNDLTLTLGSVVPTAIGSKVDGSAFTGKLVVTGNTKAFAAGSSLGDTLIGGSGVDTIKAAINGGILTGNGGADTFDVSVALGGTTSTFNTTTITDFTKGDKIKLINTGTSVFTAAKVDLSGAASVGAALDLLAAGNGSTNGIVKWGNYGGNTYIVNDNTSGATFAATDIMVKMTGTLDLSTSTYATDTLTFA